MYHVVKKQDRNATETRQKLTLWTRFRRVSDTFQTEKDTKGLKLDRKGANYVYNKQGYFGDA